MNANLGTLRALFVLSKYRGRVLEGVAHDIRQRFSGSALGIVWLFLFPTMQLAIYAGLYSLVFKIRVPDLSEVGYVVLVFSGLVPLMAFNEALTAATSSLSANKNLLLNTVFPAELIPLRAALAAHVTSLVGLAVTLVVGFAAGRTSLASRGTCPRILGFAGYVCHGNRLDVVAIFAGSA